MNDNFKRELDKESSKFSNNRMVNVVVKVGFFQRDVDKADESDLEIVTIINKIEKSVTGPIVPAINFCGMV